MLWAPWRCTKTCFSLNPTNTLPRWSSLASLAAEIRHHHVLAQAKGLTVLQRMIHPTSWYLRPTRSCIVHQRAGYLEVPFLCLSHQRTLQGLCLTLLVLDGGMALLQPRWTLVLGPSLQSSVLPIVSPLLVGRASLPRRKLKALVGRLRRHLRLRTAPFLPPMVADYCGPRDP